MQKHYASYKLSLLAKKAGFNEKCNNGYDFSNNDPNLGFAISRPCFNNELGNEKCTAPELTNLQQWCYEKFGVWIGVYEYPFKTYGKFDCPYKALEHGLMKFLKSKVQ